jgi:hypothetical protein
MVSLISPKAVRSVASGLDYVSDPNIDQRMLGGQAAANALAASLMVSWAQKEETLPGPRGRRLLTGSPGYLMPS